MADPTQIYKGSDARRQYIRDVSDDEDEGTASFVWEKIIKRFPGYAYEVLDAISPIKTRNIDMSEDLVFGVLPLQVPPLIRGVGQLAKEAVVGNPVARERRNRRREISRKLIQSKSLTPVQRALLEKELDVSYHEDYPMLHKSGVKASDLLATIKTHHPTWSALYTQMRDSLPGAGQIEAILLMEPEHIPDATERFVASWKDEPWDTLVWGLAFAKAGLLAKADKARKAGNVALANRYLKAANTVGLINPEEVVFGATGSVVKGLGYILPSPYQDGVIREPYARGKETDILAKDAAKKYGAGEKGTIMSVLSDSQEIASRESSLAHIEKPDKFDPLITTPDTVKGVLNRIALTRHMADQKMAGKLEGLADAAGMSYDDVFDPQFQTRLFEGVIKAFEEGDKAKRAELSKKVFDLVGNASTSFELGSRALNLVEEKTKQIDADFKEAYRSDEHKRLMDTEVGDLDLTGEGSVAETEGRAAGIGFDRSQWERIEESIFSHVLDGDIGKRLLSTFDGSNTEGMINVEKAVRGALPELADLKTRIESGNISSDYSIMEELAFAIESVDALIKRYANQGNDYNSVVNVIERELSQMSLLDDPLETNARNLYKIVLRGRSNPGALRDFIRGYVEKVKAMDDAPVPKEEVFASILGEDFDEIPESTAFDLAPFIPNVVATAQKLVTDRGRTWLIDPAGSIKPGVDAVDRWLSEDVAEALAHDLSITGVYLQIGDIVRLRETLADRLQMEVNAGRMTRVGAGKLQNQLYTALNADIEVLIESAVEAGRLDTADATHFRDLTKRYSDQMDTQDTETSRMIRRFETKPEDFMPWLVKSNPERLAELKSRLGEEAFAAHQADIFKYIVQQAQDKETGVPTHKGFTDQLDKLQVPLEDLLGEHAQTLRGLVDEVQRLEMIPEIRQTKAYEFIVNNYDKSGRLYSELVKTDSLFTPDEIANLRTVLGDERWEAMKVNLLGQMFERSQFTKAGNEKALKNLLGKMTARDKNRLADIFGEEQAKELVEMSEFWNRHLNLSGWNKNSNTAFHQEARNWLQKRSAVAMMRNFVYWMQVRNVSSRKLNVVDFASASIIFGVFAGPWAWKKYISSEAGREFMMRGGIKVPGTKGMYVTRESLDKVADFMLQHRLELGLTAHTIGERQTELEREERERERQERNIVPPWRNPTERFLPE